MTGFETLKIATSYVVNGKETKNVPAGEKDFNNVEVIYMELPG